MCMRMGMRERVYARVDVGERGMSMCMILRMITDACARALGDSPLCNDHYSAHTSYHPLLVIQTGTTLPPSHSPLCTCKVAMPTAVALKHRLSKIEKEVMASHNLEMHAVIKHIVGRVTAMLDVHDFLRKWV